MNWMSILGLCLIVAGTIFSFIGTYKSGKESQTELTSKVQEKNQTIDSINANNIKLIEQNTLLISSNNDVASSNGELFSQNKDLLLRINDYQKDIDVKNKKIKDLEETSKKVERGIASTIQFDGSYVVKQGGSMLVTGGTEENGVYNQLSDLYKAKKLADIIELCDKSISKSPQWFTPYLFKASALFNMDMKNKDEAVKLLEFVESNTHGDPQFILQIAKVYSNLGLQTKSDELIKTIPKEDSLDLVNTQKKVAVRNKKK